MRSHTSCYNSSTTDLDHSSRVHGDAVVWILGQLIEGHGCALVDGGVLGLEVAHQRGHGTSFTEGCPVAAPHAALADGLSEMPTEPVIGLWRAEQAQQETAGNIYQRSSH